MSERAFPFIRMNEREGKPRTRGITEIRGPYYTPMGKHYLEDVLETMGEYVDSLKFAGGSFTLMPEKQLKEIIDLAHRYNVLVSTGGFIEHVLTQGPEIVNRYIEECRIVGFDILEISSGFITIPVDDWLRLVEKVQHAGAYMIMIESEGITENIKSWRTDVAAKIIGALGLEKVMFEAADPDVFAWYIKNYGPEVNLFVDHSQIVQLECLRAGLWGTKSLWGRVLTFKG